MNESEEQKETEKELTAQRAKELEQMNLALGDLKVYIDYSKEPGHYTGIRWLEQHPELREPAARLFAGGFSNYGIAQKLNSTSRTMRQVRNLLIKETQKQTEILKSYLFVGGTEAVEKVIELIPDLKHADKAAITAGIMIDKLAQLSGIPTAKIEISGRVDICAEIGNLLREAEQKMKQATARVLGENGTTRGRALPMLEDGEAA